MNQITNQIWIGNSQDARNATAMKAVGITHILNCAEDLDQAVGWNQGFRHFQCGLSDGENNAHFYLAGVSILEGILSSPSNKVLVHCHEGRSRSVYITALYLFKVGSESVRSAIELIREKGRDVLVKDGHFKSYSP